MGASVRRLGRLDLETLEILVKHERESFKEGGFSQWELPMFAEHGRLYVLEVNGKIAGAAELMKDWEDPATAYLAGMSVGPAWRNKGWGKRFIRELLTELNREGVAEVILTVDPRNAAARRVYEKAGFNATETHLDKYGRGEDRIVMRLELKEKP